MPGARRHGGLRFSGVRVRQAGKYPPNDPDADGIRVTLYPQDGRDPVTLEADMPDYDTGGVAFFTQNQTGGSSDIRGGRHDFLNIGGGGVVEDFESYADLNEVLDYYRRTSAASHDGVSSDAYEGENALQLADDGTSNPRVYSSPFDNGKQDLDNYPSRGDTFEVFHEFVQNFDNDAINNYLYFAHQGDGSTEDAQDFDRYQVDLLADLQTFRLTEVVGGTYTVKASTSFSYPASHPYYRVRVEWGVDL